MTIQQKLASLLTSRRFYAAIAAVLVIVFEDILSLNPEQAQTIVSVVMAWIIGDSLQKTKPTETP